MRFFRSVKKLMELKSPKLVVGVELAERLEKAVEREVRYPNGGLCSIRALMLPKLSKSDCGGMKSPRIMLQIPLVK